MKNVHAGIAPLRELGLEPGTDVDLLIDDHHMAIPYNQQLLNQIASFVIPEGAAVSSVFESTKGQTLASVSPSSSPSAAKHPSHAGNLPEFPHDSALPTTRLQIRYDGRRHVIVANRTSMLSQVVNYIRNNISKTGRILVGVPAKDIPTEDGTLDMHSMLDSIITIQQ